MSDNPGAVQDNNDIDLAVPGAAGVDEGIGVYFIDFIPFVFINIEFILSFLCVII